MKRHFTNTSKYFPSKMIKEWVGYLIKFSTSRPNADHLTFQLQISPDKTEKVICYDLNKKNQVNKFITTQSIQMKNVIEKELPEGSPLCKLTMINTTILAKAEKLEIDFQRLGNPKTLFVP